MTARPGSEVAIVSPWMADVELDCPALFHLHSAPMLSHLFQWLEGRDVHLILVIRDHEYRLKRLLKNAKSKHEIKLISVDHIHTKAVITERLALTTSANLLDTSLYRNRESVNLRENAFESTRRWLAFEQDLRF